MNINLEMIEHIIGNWEYNKIYNIKIRDSRSSFALLVPPTCGAILKIGYRLDHIERHIAYAISVIALFHRRTRNHHVRVADGFDLGTRIEIKKKPRISWFLSR